MFKLVVLSALLALAAAKPGYLHSVHAVPAAVSHSSRVDLHQSHPTLALVHAAPVVAVAPAVVAHHVPAAVSHQARVDYHHSAPVVHAIPAVHTVHAVPAFHTVPALHSVHAVQGHAVHHPVVHSIHPW